MPDVLSQTVSESLPASNTGAQITRADFASSPTLDWLSFTLHADQGECLEWIASVFGGLTPLDRGGMGYTDGALILGTGRVLWHPGRLEMGVHVDLPSSALGRFSGSLDAVLCGAYNLGFKCSRFDVCIDRRVTLDSVRAALLARSGVVTHCRDVTEIVNMWRSGSTFYVGAASSDSRVRFYDKAAEQKIEGVWSRCEVQFRRDRAQEVFSWWFGGGDIAAAMRGVVDFRDVPEGANVSRCEACEWWLDWVCAGCVVHLPAHRRECSIAKVAAWLDHAVAPSLAFLLFACGGDQEVLADLLASGRKRLKPWQMALLA